NAYVVPYGEARQDHIACMLLRCAIAWCVPPYMQCVARCRREAKEGARPTEVHKRQMPVGSLGTRAMCSATHAPGPLATPRVHPIHTNKCKSITVSRTCCFHFALRASR